MILIEKADDLKSYLKDNFKAILTVLMVIAGLVVGIILAQNPQILRSRASGETLTISNSGSDTINATAPSSSFQINFNADSFGAGSSGNSDNGKVNFKSQFTPKY